MAVLGLIALGCLCAASWGDPSKLLAQGDLFPITLLNPGRWLTAGLHLWGRDLRVGGDLSYTSGYFSSSLLEWVPLTLGIPAAALQRVEGAVLLAGMLLATYGLLADLRITTRILPRFLGSVAFVFSLALIAHTADTVVYVVFLCAVLLPLLYGRYLRASGWAAVALGAAFVLASQLASYLFINPPQLVVVTVQVLLVGFYVWYREPDKKGTVWRSLLLIAATLVASAWWIVPAYVSTFNPAVRMTAVTSIADWAWTHARASILNDWRFTGSWGWELPQYFPWATYYEPRATQIIQLWPLATISVALLLSRQRATSTTGQVLVWTGAALVAIFLLKGLHPPLQAVNTWLYQYVPGFFLFREPTTKFSEPLDFAIAVLLVTLLAQLERIRSPRLPVSAAGAIMGIVVVGVLAVPAFNGMTTEASAPSSDMGAASRHIAVPAYWFQMSDYMRRLPDDDGYALMPNDDYYQQLYRWGYYGLDILPMTLLPRPVLYMYDSPQGYSSASPALDHLVEQMVSQLHAGASTDLARQLGLFGVRYVLLRHDVATADLPNRKTIRPERVAAILQEMPNVTLVKSIGALDLYAITPTLVRPRVFAVPETLTTVRQSPDLVSVTDGARAGHTTVSSLAPSCATVSGSPVGTPRVIVLSQDPTSYTVQVTTAHAPVLLVLNQSFNPDWIATTASGDGQPSPCSGTTIQHVTANGYANAWWITRPGTSVVHLAFTRQRWANVADMLSAAVLIVAALVLLLAAVAAVIHRQRHPPSHAARA